MTAQPVALGESSDPSWSFCVSLASILLERVSIPSQTSMPLKVPKSANLDMHNFSGRWCYSAAARHFALLGSGDDGGSGFFPWSRSRTTAGLVIDSSFRLRFFVFELTCGVLRALATSLWEEPKEGVIVV